MNTNTTNNTNITPKWFALKVQPGFETAVSASLVKRGISSIKRILLPVEKTQKFTRSGRKVTNTKILFPGYLFVCAGLLDEANAVVRDDFERILDVTGVHGFAGAVRRVEGDTAVLMLEPMAESEVADVQSYMEANAETNGRVINPIKAQDNIEVVGGPFMGCEGLALSVDETKGKALVSLQVFGRETQATVDIAMLEKNT